MAPTLYVLAILTAMPGGGYADIEDTGLTLSDCVEAATLWETTNRDPDRWAECWTDDEDDFLDNVESPTDEEE